MPNWRGRAGRRVWRGLAEVALALSLCLIAPAHALGPESSMSPCHVGRALEAIDAPLPRAAAGLSGRRALTIVAFGSSSTYGTGASTPAASYPSRLERDLATRFPAARITVVNQGVPGEDTDAMMRRIDRDVLALRPDLVIWQAGSNDILLHDDLDRFARSLRRGIAQMRAAGADVLLLDPQYSPRIAASVDAEAYVRAIRATGAALGVPVLRRWDIMRAWAASELFPKAALASADGLHMTDTGYACLAELAAGEIAAAL